jgi:prepilin-type N-terminal cleavage/methylation domain-containing protein
MNRDGITLIELLVVIAIIGVLIALVAIDTDWLMRETRLTEARDQLLADIEDVKLKSISDVPHAIYVAGGEATQYSVRRLNDANNNFRKDTGETWSTILRWSTFSGSNVRVALNGDVDGTSNAAELWFDRKGVPRLHTWGEIGRSLSVGYTGGSWKTIAISRYGRVQYEQR